MTTMERMQKACARVQSGRSERRTFIQACSDVADEMVAEVTRLRSSQIGLIAKQMRADSERWFPEFHSNPPVPLAVHYAIGMMGEAGELANVVKKGLRVSTKKKLKVDSEAVGDELADVFTYVLLVADELGIDLLAAYERKRFVNEGRWGTAGE